MFFRQLKNIIDGSLEMGSHFDTVLKPRLQKVIYSKDWKDGNPVSRQGSSHAFKYLRLESYEDALDNITFEAANAQTMFQLEDYVLSYLLNSRRGRARRC